MRFTNDYYTDGPGPLVSPSVIISPMECIPVTDGSILSVKLFNDVVNKIVMETKSLVQNSG